MSNNEMYHEGNRKLQDRFDSRRLADRLENVTLHTTFSDKDIQLIQSSFMFFLATADPEGRPDCSYKGGQPGFVKVIDDKTIAFPSYDGNGMFKSLGNILKNPHVGLLFLDFENQPSLKIRLNGVASIDENDPLLEEYHGAQLVVRVEARQIFPNCPRYVPTMQMLKPSVYPPKPDYDPPAPSWKKDERFRDYLPK